MAWLRRFKIWKVGNWLQTIFDILMLRWLFDRLANRTHFQFMSGVDSSPMVLIDSRYGPIGARWSSSNNRVLIFPQISRFL